MRARPAYISSLGTTAILVAAALLMLGVVGAIVAFRGWPGSATGSAGVQSVPLAPSGRAAQAALVRRVATAHGVERSKARAARRPAAAAKRANLSTAGLVKGEASGPRVVPGIVMEPTASSPMQAQPSSPGRTPAVPQASPTPSTAPERPLPPPSDGPLAGSGGGITIPLPIPVPPAPAGPLPDPTGSLSDPAGPLPSPDGVTTMVGSLLAGGTPPPPLLDELGLR
jgi:hypothetical protein